MTESEHLRVRVRLAIAKDIAKDFRENTSIGNIIQQYESRLHNYDKSRHQQSGESG